MVTSEASCSLIPLLLSPGALLDFIYKTKKLCSVFTRNLPRNDHVKLGQDTWVNGLVLKVSPCHRLIVATHILLCLKARLSQHHSPGYTDWLVQAANPPFISSLWDLSMLVARKLYWAAGLSLCLQTQGCEAVNNCKSHLNRPVYALQMWQSPHKPGVCVTRNESLGYFFQTL